MTNCDYREVIRSIYTDWRTTTKHGRREIQGMEVMRKNRVKTWDWGWDGGGQTYRGHTWVRLSVTEKRRTQEDVGRWRWW